MEPTQVVSSGIGYEKVVIRALVDKDENGHAAALAERVVARLRAGDMTVRVEYSTLNY